MSKEDTFYRPAGMIEFDNRTASPIAAATEQLLNQWPGCKGLIGFVPVFADQAHAEAFYTDRGNPVGDIDEVVYEESEELDCTMCEGYGRVDTGDEDEQDVCPRCDGSGREPS